MKAPNGALVLLQRKHDGSLQLCIDYLGLNKVIVKNKYPILLIANFFDQLRLAKYFSKLELRPGFFKCGLRKEMSQRLIVSLEMKRKSSRLRLLRPCQLL